MVCENQFYAAQQIKTLETLYGHANSFGTLKLLRKSGKNNKNFCLFGI